VTRDEEGVAVVIAVGVASILVFVALVGGGVTALVAGHRKVQTAADLAALAGAGAVQRGAQPCVAASHVASRNGSELRQCDADGQVVLVELELRLPEMFGGRVLRARARAGPVGMASSADQSTFPNTLLNDMWIATRSGFTLGTL